MRYSACATVLATAGCVFLVTSAGAMAQQARGLAVRAAEGASLRLRYATFDPLVGEPALPDGLAAAEPGDGVDAFIIQLAEVALDDHREALRDAGIAIYKYLPDRAFLVHANAAEIAAVSRLPFVRWTGAYHPAYRIEPALLAALADPERGLGPTRVNIQVFERGARHKEIVAARVGAIGGIVDRLTPNGFIIEATLDGTQLADIARLPEVMWIDRWSAFETDMNIARAIGGADIVETAGYTGAGVRGEICDTNLYDAHVDFQAIRPIFHGSRGGSDDHGTGTYGIVFGDGTGQAIARGMIPDAQGIFADFDFLSDRYAHTAELVQAPYEAVFQSNSWGSGLTTEYNSISAEMDDIILLNDFVITQSQSNAGSRDSRPQAWAKNVVSVGGINHQNTADRADDFWGGASIGPAADGRVKPDLSHFYENIWTTDDAQSGYRNFGGTSGATPIVAGHFGLFFQMWADGIFGNPVDTNGTVFDNRPHFTTAKAMLINHAYQYAFSGTNHNLTRTHQGWGMPDIGRLHAMRDSTFIVNEDVALQATEMQTYFLEVPAGQSEFRATLVYADPAGTTSSNLHRINDLSLKATSPSGTVYWGNNGLLAGNYSTAAGSANTIDTVESVLLQNPVAGLWRIDVIASEVNEDQHLETPETDADFALVVSGVIPPVEGAVEVTAIDILRGTIINGGIEQIASSDDVHLRTRSGFGQTFIDLHSMDLQVAADAGGPVAGTFDLAIESRLDQPAGTAQIRLLNHGTNQYDMVDSHALGNADATRVISNLAGPTYVGADGSISLRIRHLVFVPIFAFRFDSFFDLIEFTID
jgi:serine protease AprX